MMHLSVTLYICANKITQLLQRTESWLDSCASYYFCWVLGVAIPLNSKLLRGINALVSKCPELLSLDVCGPVPRQGCLMSFGLVINGKLHICCNSPKFGSLLGRHFWIFWKMFGSCFCTASRKHLVHTWKENVNMGLDKQMGSERVSPGKKCGVYTHGEPKKGVWGEAPSKVNSRAEHNRSSASFSVFCKLTS